jgi:hypothetical protein
MLLQIGVGLPTATLVVFWLAINCWSLFCGRCYHICCSYKFNDVEIRIKVIFISKAERVSLQSVPAATTCWVGSGCDWAHKMCAQVGTNDRVWWDCNSIGYIYITEWDRELRINTSPSVTDYQDFIGQNTGPGPRHTDWSPCVVNGGPETSWGCGN